jgi:uncharacterized protein YqeY
MVNIMSLLQQIKNDQVIARKNKEGHRATLLTTLYSEAAMIGKNQNRESTDSEVMSVIKKFISNNEMTLQYSPNENIRKENEILSKYLPEQMNEDDIITIIKSNSFANVGEVMKFFKENFDGKYDGKTVSGIAKDAFK